MVCPYILHSVSNELAEVLLYTNSEKELKEDMKQSFGESNGPLMYQIRREISSFRQGVMLIAVYKIKRLWAELIVLKTYDCHASKVIADREKEEKVMQFLMGFNDSFDNIEN